LPDVSISDHTKTGLILEMPPADELRKKLEVLGISDNSRVIVYYGKDWVSPTTRVLWLKPEAKYHHRGNTKASPATMIMAEMPNRGMAVSAGKSRI